MRKREKEESRTRARFYVGQGGGLSCNDARAFTQSSFLTDPWVQREAALNPTRVSSGPSRNVG